MNKHTPVRERRTPRGLVLVAEAAEILGLSPWTVREKARLRQLPYYRPFGARGRLAFSPEDLSAFLRASRVEPRAPGAAPVNR